MHNQCSIHIVDDLPPEAAAMLQALYSRSPRSVHEHLQKVKLVGADKFMAQYYIGYGHKSIGDCGTTSIFVEGISMLAAKALQQWPLYSGQEASTRYMDFSKSRCVFETPEERDMQEQWMRLYTMVTEELRQATRQAYPIEGGTTVAAYDNAINAWVFDRTRGLLPAGASTAVSWHTNLRQAHDHLAGMERHPLAEVKGMARTIRAGLAARYPSSFLPNITAEAAGYADSYHRLLTYGTNGGTINLKRVTPMFTHSMTMADIPAYLHSLLYTRPPKVELPHELEQFGRFNLSFSLDFGSYRDLQRHRRSILSVPELNPYEFHPWYLSHYNDTVLDTIHQLMRDLRNLPPTPSRQYAVPMGALVPCTLSCGLPQLVYMAELRSGPTVHPTLRIVAHAMVDHLRQNFPDMPIYADTSPTVFSLRRGTQTINEPKP